MSKFKVGDRIIFNGSNALGVVKRFNNLNAMPYLIEFDTGGIFRAKEDEFRLMNEGRPTLEDMNNRVRRDGGKFKVCGYSEETGQYIGTIYIRNHICVATWFANGGYASENGKSDWDLIEKPVVRVFQVHGHIEHLGNRYACVSSFREENGVTELLRVEVVKS